MDKAACIRIINQYTQGLRYADFGSGSGDEVNCLGLVRKFLRDHMGIAEPFPWPGDVKPGDAGLALHSFFRIVNTPNIGDIGVMDGQHGEGMHVGVYIYNGTGRGILHASSRCGIIWSPIRSVTIRGLYRHRGLL